MGREINTYSVLVGNTERQRLLRRRVRKYADNIKTDFKE